MKVALSKQFQEIRATYTEGVLLFHSLLEADWVIDTPRLMEVLPPKQSRVRKFLGAWQVLPPLENPESFAYFLSEQPEGGRLEEPCATAGQGEKAVEEESDSTFGMEGMSEFSMSQEDILEGNWI